MTEKTNLDVRVLTGDILMHLRLIVISFISILVLSGCASSTMSVAKDRTERLNPIGLYVVVSTQHLFTDLRKHNTFVAHPIAEYLQGLFAKKGYLIKPLNSKVKKAEVFKRYAFYFDVDKKSIAKAGRNEGCASVLIVYLAFSGEPLRFKNGLTVYRECSLYGWLVDTKNGNIISSSDTTLNSFDAFLENNPARLKEKRDIKVYRSFLISSASEMFKRFPKRIGNK